MYYGIAISGVGPLSRLPLLAGVPMESLRLRFSLLQSLNNTLQTFFMPLVDLRPALGGAYSRSTAHLLANARGLMFYDTKTVFLNRILNATAQRKPDQAAPEITLDPLENVGGKYLKRYRVSLPVFGTRRGQFYIKLVVNK